jgi:hypothetical protein
VEGDGEEVEVVTLDSLFAGQNRPLTFLKADVEGAEPDLIAGAAETIFQNKPKIAITTYHVKEHADQLTEALRKIHPGYRFRRKGFITGGYPVMLHAWMD